MNKNPIIMNPNGSPMAKFNKDTCTQVLVNMLPKNPVIYYVHQDEPIGKMTKHTYKFFVINEQGHYNVSGLVTAIFGVNVNDRSSTFSVNTMSHEDDVKAFQSNLARLLDQPELQLADLVLSAQETLEFVISPQAMEFVPLVVMPSADRTGDEKQSPVELSS